MDTPQTPEPRPQAHRANDTGAGIPLSEGLQDARPLTDSEVADHRQSEQERMRLGERLLHDQTAAAVSLPRAVVRAVVLASLFAASLIGLLVVAQIASLASDVGTMPAPLGWILGLLAALFVAAILWVASKLTLSLIRLQRNPSVDLAALQTLNERQAWHRLAAHHANRAEIEIRGYLANYSLHEADRPSLVAAGLTADEFDTLRQARQRLLAEDVYLPPTDWLAEFAATFQSTIDTAAERQTRSYGARTAVGTALSPIPVLDQAVVLYSSLRLVRDLLVLYNVRPTACQTAFTFARAIVQTYLGGMAQHATEAGSDAAWREILGTPEELLGTSAAAGVASSATAKFAEGAVNGLLVWRLGRRTVTFLQPVTPST